ncbi:MAG: presqualene diphosphate synthase HpnD [Frankiaceae bacterium]|nr:presqualene diphosphate synthase HpnD [Frankiaceae bacterium]MBV9368803.1 presqualene diphosphate synthase HpnD [Frankiales bacterium]
MTTTTATAFETCIDITKTQARNFSYGIRLLPPEKRAALSAVYALARRIDDIGDGDLPPSEKRVRLAEMRASLENLGAATDPVLLAVRDATSRHPIPLAAFGELIDGVERDVDGGALATFDELVAYCRCVAGSIGRLCLSIFGASDPIAGAAYADALGIALQQTNILRDIREDLQNGRVYLPQEDLDRFGVELRLGPDGALVDDNGRLTALIRWSADRARVWYDDGLRLVPLLDRRSAACCAAMAGIYRRLLDRTAADPSLVFDRRLSLSTWQKSGVAARALARRRA